MVTINFTIPNEKIQRVIDAIKSQWPVEEGFTDAQWAKEAIRRMIINLVQSYELEQAKEDAFVDKDNSIIS